MKKQEAKQKTMACLLKVARRHFTQYGYHAVSLEKVAEQAGVTRGAVYHHFKNKKGLFLAVLGNVQQDIAAQTESAAMQSDDMWQQLILGCVGFVKAANAKPCRRILLVDAPAVVGWHEWRKADKENSMDVLQGHIDDLKQQGYLNDAASPELMTRALSGALNELALGYTAGGENDGAISTTVAQLAEGFKKNR